MILLLPGDMEYLYGHVMLYGTLVAASFLSFLTSEIRLILMMWRGFNQDLLHLILSEIGLL
jgi:hypothetical protein